MTAYKIIRIYRVVWGDSPRDAVRRFLEEEAADPKYADIKLSNEFAAEDSKGGWKTSFLKQLFGK